MDIDSPANVDLLATVPAEILNPTLAIEEEIYRDWVERMKKDRREFLRSHNVAATIINTI